MPMTMSEAGKLGYAKAKATLDRLKQERIDKYNLNPKLCKRCGAKIGYSCQEKTFCTRSCANTFHNYRRKIVSNCKLCGKIKENEFRRRRFCSKECELKFHAKQRVERIDKAGVAPQRNTARKYLREKHGWKCSICKLTEWMGQEVPLVMDHIDGNSYNNKLDNLRLVCGNCDMQLPTYKGRNKGNGRHNRRKRYNEGKSY